MYQFTYSRIPLVRSSSESIVQRSPNARGLHAARHGGPNKPSPVRVQSRRIHRELQTQSSYPILRANPFPEVTDLFCRLPLSTLFYQLEATHLGDLMRL